MGTPEPVIRLTGVSGGCLMHLAAKSGHLFQTSLVSESLINERW